MEKKASPVSQPRPVSVAWSPTTSKDGLGAIGSLNNGNNHRPSPGLTVDHHPGPTALSFSVSPPPQPPTPPPYAALLQEIVHRQVAHIEKAKAVYSIDIGITYKGTRYNGSLPSTSSVNSLALLMQQLLGVSYIEMNNDDDADIRINGEIFHAFDNEGIESLLNKEGRIEVEIVGQSRDHDYTAEDGMIYRRVLILGNTFIKKAARSHQSRFVCCSVDLDRIIWSESQESYFLGQFKGELKVADIVRVSFPSLSYFSHIDIAVFNTIVEYGTNTNQLHLRSNTASPTPTTLSPALVSSS
jgi:hypothetical protein